MASREEIEKQLDRLGVGGKLRGRREMDELPGILWEDEALEQLAQGKYNDNGGILVATNKRLIFIDKALLGSRLRVEDFPYDKLTSIQYDTGSFFSDSATLDPDRRATITIFASGNKAEIKHVHKDQVRGFCDYVRARTSGVAEHASISPAAAGGGGSVSDVVSQLERLAKLKEQGFLTDEEFQAQKNRLLAS